MNKNEIKNKNILILGAGKTGLSTADFLKDKAKKVIVSESKYINKELEDKINILSSNGVEFEFGKNSDTYLKNADLIIISPGISPFSNLVEKINSYGTPIISDIELASYYIEKPIIAITGTNGKTTTTSLISHIINSSGKKAVECGNIGKPFLETIDLNPDYFVLEISSFQIFYSPTISAHIAICLNITPDHIDWHKTFEHYLESKQKLFLQQKNNSWSILNLNDKYTKDFRTNGQKFYFSLDSTYKNQFDYFSFYEYGDLKIKFKTDIETILNKSDLKIIGTHNIENVLSAIAVAKILDLKETRKNLKSFSGVEHRLEFVKEKAGKEFYNDSKATNPEATIKAIEAISSEKKGKKVSLILGGKDKNTDLGEMISKIKSHISEVLIFGEAKERFYNEIKKEVASSSELNLKIVNNLTEAINESAKSGTDIVLFSPACASFDMFKNYEDRGKCFKEIVNKI